MFRFQSFAVVVMVCVLTAGGSSAAFGAAVITDRSSSLNTEVRVSNAVVDPASDGSTSTAFDTFSSHIDSGYRASFTTLDGAGATASHDVTLSSNGGGFVADVDVDVTALAFDTTEGGDFYRGYAESNFNLTFTVTDTATYDISGDLFVSGSNGSNEFTVTNIRLQPKGGSIASSLFLYSTDSVSQSFSESGTLAAGEYLFVVGTHSDASANYSTDSSAGQIESGYDFLFTVNSAPTVPEPASIGSLAMLAVGLLRRRG